jgi:hypothetical protein
MVIMTINASFGTFRIVDRVNGGVRTTREPFGPVKITGPRLGLDGWIFGHIGHQRLHVPSVGLERRALGLNGSVLTRSGKPRVPLSVTSVDPESPVKRRKKKRRPRKTQAEVFMAQDEFVRKYKKRKAQQDKIERDRALHSMFVIKQKIDSGDVACLITNPMMEVG